MAFYSKTKTGQNLVFGDNSEINLSTLKHRDISSSISSTEILIKPPAGYVGQSFGFGAAAAVGHGKIVIGSTSNNDISSNNGKAYVYDLNGNLEFSLTPTSSTSGINFGCNVAINNGRIGVLSNENSKVDLYIYDLRGNFIAKKNSAIGNGFPYDGNISIGSGRIVLTSEYSHITPDSMEIYDLDGNLLKTLSSGSDYNVGDTLSGPTAIKYGKIIGWQHTNNDNNPHIWSMHDLDGQRVNTFQTDTNYEIDFPYESAMANDYFGSSMDAGNQKIIFGAPYYNNQKGAIFIFDKNGSYETKIVGPGTRPNDQFGSVCAIYGNKIYGGASQNNPGGPGRGAVYIFNTDGSNQQKLIAATEPEDYLYFGEKIVANQGTLVVPCGNKNKVYVYKINEFYSDYVDEMSNNTHGYKTSLTGTPGA